MSQIFNNRLSASKFRLDSFLFQWLRQNQDWHPDLIEATSHCIIGAGKGFRPFLYLELCSDLQKTNQHSNSKSLKTALAIEFLHTYSLIHDDLPAMDDDDWRRSRPTLHKLHGDAFAILAGDALLTASFELLAEAFESSPEKVAHAIKVFAKASGAAGMIKGQWLDLKNSKGKENEKAFEADKLKKLHRLKTGALLGAVAEIAALESLPINIFKAEAEFFREWGIGLGLLFQMRDDILDLGNSKITGKSHGKDQRQGKATFANIYSTQELLDTMNELQDALIRHHPRPMSETFSNDFVNFAVRRSN